MECIRQSDKQHKAKVRLSSSAFSDALTSQHPRGTEPVTYTDVALLVSFLLPNVTLGRDLGGGL